MDVLEHGEDDAGLLRTYLDKAPPQAQATITVPAFQVLWSHHDVFLEHHRRYTLKTLSRLVERAGAVPLRMHYSSGQIGRAHVLTPVTNAHLVSILRLEKKNNHIN